MTNSSRKHQRMPWLFLLLMQVTGTIKAVENNPNNTRSAIEENAKFFSQGVSRSQPLISPEAKIAMEDHRDDRMPTQVFMNLDAVRAVLIKLAYRLSDHNSMPVVQIGRELFVIVPKDFVQKDSLVTDCVKEFLSGRLKQTLGAFLDGKLIPLTHQAYDEMKECMDGQYHDPAYLIHRIQEVSMNPDIRKKNEQDALLLTQILNNAQKPFSNDFQAECFDRLMSFFKPFLEQGEHQTKGNLSHDMDVMCRKMVLDSFLLPSVHTGWSVKYCLDRGQITGFIWKTLMRQQSYHFNREMPEPLANEWRQRGAWALRQYGLDVDKEQCDAANNRWFITVLFNDQMSGSIQPTMAALERKIEKEAQFEIVRDRSILYGKLYGKPASKTRNQTN